MRSLPYICAIFHWTVGDDLHLFLLQKMITTVFQNLNIFQTEGWVHPEETIAAPVSKRSVD